MPNPSAQRFALTPAGPAAARLFLHLLPLALVCAAVSWLLFARLADPRAMAVAVTAVVALLAPLFAPLRGAAGTDALLLAAWCLSCAATAGLLLLLVCPVPIPGRLLAASSGMGLALLMASHAGLLALSVVRGRGGHEPGPPLAAWAVTVALAVLGAAPVWLAPLAQAAGGAAVAGLAVAVSPLSHLAAATGSDLLRTDWFYRHSGIASMRYAYPAIGTVLVAYTLTCIAALGAALAAARRNRRFALQ